MRLSGSPHPMTAFAIPPAAPPAVAEAQAEFARIGNVYEDARSDLKDAQQALVVAQAEDTRSIVDAVNKGKEASDPQQRERAAAVEIARLETLIKGLRQAADEAGNTLLTTIAEHRDEWAKSLAEAAATIAASFDEIIAEARMTLAAFVPAQAGVEWIESFDANLARTGRFSPFAGGRLRVSARGSGVPTLRGEFNPADLLTLVARATAQNTTVSPRKKEMSRV